MATEVEIDGPEGETSPTIELFDIGGDTVIETIATVTENTNKAGSYKGTVATAGAGDYDVRLLSSGGDLLATARRYIGTGDQVYATSPSVNVNDALVLFDTTVTVVNSATNVELAEGPDDDGGIDNKQLLFIDQTNESQVSQRYITTSLAADHEINYDSAADFTVAVGDRVIVLALSASSPVDSSAIAVATRTEMDSNSTQLAAIVADTNELQTDDIPATLATLVANLATVDSNVDAVLADTNELQTDWANGGRLDLILDSAAAGGGLDAAGVRAAIGLASANLDTQLSDTKSVVDDILDDTEVLAAGRVLLDTTIQTVNTQSNLTLAAGGGADDVFVGATVVFINNLDNTIMSVDRVSSFDEGTNVLETDTTHTYTLAINNRVIVLADRYSTAPSVSEIRLEMDANSTQLAAIAGDTNELQTDWTNGGRLDSILDARASQTSVDAVDALVQALENISAQGVRDAMKLAPTAGSPATGSVDEHLDDIDAAGGAGLTPQEVRDAMKLAPSAGAAASDSVDDKLDDIPTASENAVALEAAIINEGDGQQVIDAILQVINTSLDLPALELQAIASQVHTELYAELALIDAAISSRSTVTTGQVRTEVDASIAAADPPSNTEFIARSLPTADYATSANQTTILNRIGAFAGTGVNTILGFMRALMRGDLSAPTDVGGTYDPTTDSVEAIRNNQSAGGGGLSAQEVRDAMKLAPSAGSPAPGSIDTHLDTIETDTDELQSNQGDWATATGFSTHSAADVRTEMDNNSTQLAAIAADTNEIQTDLTDGGRLDLIFDAIASNATAILNDTDSTIPALITGLNNLSSQNIADALKLAPSAGSPAAGSAMAIVTDVVADTNELQTDFADGGRLDTILDAVVADTNDLQTDWADGGRLDALLDLASAMNPTAAQIREEMDNNSTKLAAIVADTDELQQAGIAALITGLNNISAQGVRDAMQLAPTDVLDAVPTSIDANLSSAIGLANTAAVNSANAGANYIAQLTVTSVTNQTTLVCSGGYAEAGIYDDAWAIGVDNAEPTRKAKVKIASWDGVDTLILDKAFPFNIDVSDFIIVWAGDNELTKGEFDAVDFDAVDGQQVRDALKLAPTAGAPAAGSIDQHLDDIESAGGSGLSQQQVRDAMKLAPSAGTPAAGSVDEEMGTLLDRIGAFGGSGANTVLGFFRSLMRNDVAAPTDVGGSFDPATDSVEALRNNQATIGSGGGGSVTVTAANYGQDGDTLRLKRGNKEVLTFTGLSPDVTMSHVVFGIRDKGRSLVKVVGTITSPTEITFTITAAQALLMYQGNHNYDVFELEGYDANTGAYTDSRLVVTGDVVVDPINIRLEVN